MHCYINPIQTGGASQAPPLLYEIGLLENKSLFFCPTKLFVLQDGDDLCGDLDTKQAVKKGLLWHQRDKLFSR